MTTETIDLASFFEATEFDPVLFDRYADAAHASQAAHERFLQLVREQRARLDQGQGDPLRVALGLLILGRYGDALQLFERAPATRVRHYYAAQAALGLGRLDAALSELRAAAGRGWDPLEIDMRIAAVHVRAGKLEQAENLLGKHDHDGRDRAAWHFVQGLIAEAREQHESAMEAYDRALKLDPDHAEAAFRAARLFDLWGDDTRALELYDRLTQQPRAHVNALLNAAVIYEDLGRYDAAADCLRRVLRAFPNHTRARLYLKDVESCQRMVIEEGGEEHVDVRARLLEMPISEFELSVRARNCLKKMNIRTLGDLVRLSEPELLAYKNFGETSLNEIKAVLAKKGLRLGQGAEEAVPEELPPEAGGAARKAAPLVPPGQEAILTKPVSELELSVRARRCLQRLNVQSVGDLIQYTEADLLATRNFGVTSLSEIKTRLSDFGLALAAKKPG
ncbi:MAG: DNA-directed RNA polymerase subunit alpha C-terminal domain-containing protein [Planctomycetota bacterium]